MWWYENTNIKSFSHEIIFSNCDPNGWNWTHGWNMKWRWTWLQDGIHHVMKVTTYMKNYEMDKIDINSNAMATWMKLKQQHEWSSWLKMELIAWMKKNTIWMNLLWTWMVLFTLMDLDHMVELDHIARVDDTCDINNHNTWMKLTNVDINDMDKTWPCNDTNKVYLMDEICLYGWK